MEMKAGGGWFLTEDQVFFLFLTGLLVIQNSLGLNSQPDSIFFLDAVLTEFQGTWWRLWLYTSFFMWLHTARNSNFKSLLCGGTIVRWQILSEM